MIVAGQIKDLMAAVHLASDGSQVASGTIFAVVRLESDDADDGKFWDDNDDTWQASPVAWPTATHTEAGQWVFALPASATTGKANDSIHFTLTDNLTEASATTICGGGEHKVLSGQPAVEPDGSRAITVHTQEADTTTIPQATVSLWADASHTILVTRVTTDVSGDAALALDDGTYYHTTVKSGYTFAAGSFVVSADATHNVTGVDVAPASPSAPDLCVVFGTILDASGDPVVGETITANILTPATSDSNRLSNNQVSADTDANGFVELELIRESQVTFSTESLDMRGRYTVPDAASQDLATWVAD
jgi:hypothetical protein